MKELIGKRDWHKGFQEQLLEDIKAYKDKKIVLVTGEPGSGMTWKSLKIADKGLLREIYEKRKSTFNLTKRMEEEE